MLFNLNIFTDADFSQLSAQRCILFCTVLNLLKVWQVLLGDFNFEDRSRQPWPSQHTSCVQLSRIAIASFCASLTSTGIDQCHPSLRKNVEFNSC